MFFIEIIVVAFKRPVRVLLKLSQCCASLLIAQLLFVRLIAQLQHTIAQFMSCSIAVFVWDQHSTAPARPNTTHPSSTRRHHTMIAEIKKRGFLSNAIYDALIAKINRFYPLIDPTYALPQRQSNSLSLLYQRQIATTTLCSPFRANYNLPKNISCSPFILFPLFYSKPTSNEQFSSVRE